MGEGGGQQGPRRAWVHHWLGARQEATAQKMGNSAPYLHQKTRQAPGHGLKHANLGKAWLH